MKDIQTPSVQVDMLTVCSYEMNVYLVELEIAGDQGLMYEGDRPMRFHSSQHIRDVFDGLNIVAAQMLHESPYDEMIGNPASAQAASFMPFSMRQPH
jgi:hypothetical protein